MVATIDLHDLLSVLQRLFYQASRIDLEQRLNRHKTQSAQVGVDISEKLIQHIDKLSTASRKDRTTTESLTSATDDYVNMTSPVRRRGKVSTPADDLDNSLRDHLQKCRSHTFDDSSIGRQLKQSTWEHIHFALISAREGNESLAKLHADIAAQAMKVACQFLENEEYQLLSDDIETALLTD